MNTIKGLINPKNSNRSAYAKKIMNKIYRKVLFIAIIWIAFIFDFRVGHINTFSFALSIMLDILLIWDIIGIANENITSLHTIINDDNKECVLITSKKDIVATVKCGDRVVIVDNGYGLSIRREDKKDKSITEIGLLVFISSSKAEQARQKITEIIKGLD